MRERTLACLLQACMLLSPLANAADALRAVSSDVERDGPLLRVVASVSATAPLATCWSTAVDFDRVASFIPHMTSSRVVSGPGEPLLVRQLGEANAGLFSTPIDVTLHMLLEPQEGRIEFERVAGNMRQMRGDWTFTGDAAHCSIAYEARIEPAFWVPPLLGPYILRAQVEEQLRGLAAEIERRAAPDASQHPDTSSAAAR